jgi:GTPase Era involved in 16S rRNA processing
MTSNTVEERIQRLEEHLQRENPVLAGCVQSFRKLDRVAQALGFAGPDESYATQVHWWPVISVLGTFSAGKSTFLNQFVGRDLQRTGNQAVDDKFTVVCYGSGDPVSLPGIALDNDPRFPLYQISQSIDRVSSGEGRRVDSYLQLKTVESEALRGKIMIDSPGFDADIQRTATLVIIDQIIDLSDLVLVFFDARHPEPGAMADTLKHLVGNAIQRPDASKFLYILNQIDNVAREDNPEEVVAAWQRALAQYGLTAGRFYRSFALDAAVPIDNEQIRERLIRKRDEDLADIQSRMRQVEIERAYRVVSKLEETAEELRDELVPKLNQARQAWLRRSRWIAGGVLGLLAAGLLWWGLESGLLSAEGLQSLLGAAPLVQAVVAVTAVAALGFIYLKLRDFAGYTVVRSLRKQAEPDPQLEKVARGMDWNLRAWWASPGARNPRGWSRRNQKRVAEVLAEADSYIQSLNDRYARPSGDGNKTPGEPASNATAEPQSD